MVEDFRRQSPLAHLGLEARATEEATDGARKDAGVTMGERPFRGLVDLRGNPRSTNFTKAFEESMGFKLPTKALTSASHGQVRALWMGPDEWWIDVPGDGAGTAETLRQAFGDQDISVVDVSDYYTVIALAGRNARDLLAKGCPLDLHERAFASGQTAGSVLSKAPISLVRTDDGKDDAAPEFELYVRRSFAEYVWLWLEDAAREYGMRVAA